MAKQKTAPNKRGRIRFPDQEIHRSAVDVKDIQRASTGSTATIHELTSGAWTTAPEVCCLTRGSLYRRR